MQASTVRRRPRVLILESDPAEVAQSRAFLEAMGCEVVGSVAYPGDGIPAAALDATALAAARLAATEHDAPALDAPSLDAPSLDAPALDATPLDATRGDAAHGDALGPESWVAASIAHDLNNAITALRAQLYVAEARLGAAVSVTECQQILDHCTTLAKRLLASSMPRERASRAAPPKVDLRHCVRDAMRIANLVLPSNVVVRLELGVAPSFVCFHPELIIDALVNLILNARDALPHGGSIAVSIAPLAGAYHQLTVRDDGVGMVPETLTSAFEPFFTTKEGERGLGLGLPGVRRTIEAAGGTVDITSQAGLGTVVRVLLPRAASDEP